MLIQPDCVAAGRRIDLGELRPVRHQDIVRPIVPLTGVDIAARAVHCNVLQHKPGGAGINPALNIIVALIAEQTVLIADREREITEKDALLAEQDRTIRQLQSDLAWERSRARQLESVVTLSPDSTPATVKRPDGATVEVMHATARASHEIEPPVIDGQPDYPNWAKQVARRTSKLSALELHWLLADNSAHFDTYERLFPGAGTALENRVMTRIHELEETRNH